MLIIKEKCLEELHRSKGLWQCYKKPNDMQDQYCVVDWQISQTNENISGNEHFKKLF